MPELLRVQGLPFRSMPQSQVDDAELLLQSLELSRRYGARAWQLRTATDLAALFANQGCFQDWPGALAAGVRAVRRRF
jgi:hypothetical protein